MSWFQKLKSNLTRSSSQLIRPMTNLFTKKKLDAQTLDELEHILIHHDFGAQWAKTWADKLRAQKFDKGITLGAVKDNLITQITEALAPHAQPLIPDSCTKPWICLMVGVNGSGKTTTIGKLAAKWIRAGKTVEIAACDTFRAAATAQLQAWGERSGASVHTAPQASDPAALAYTAASQSQADILLIDTAGRLHNQDNLMAELAKIVRVLQKVNPDAPHACTLVLDGSVGQNALSQVDLFSKAAPLSGLIVTKLDGAAKAGILVRLCETYKLPLCAIGAGEGLEDLADFDPATFARALLGSDE